MFRIRLPLDCWTFLFGGAVGTMGTLLGFIIGSFLLRYWGG